MMPDENFLWNIVSSLTASQYLIQEDGLGERLIPAQIQIYPQKAHDDLAQRRTYNIFKFSKQRGEFQDYNIIPCFEETHLLHIMIKMSWSMDMDLEANEELQRYARYSVRTTAKITALRVEYRGEVLSRVTCQCIINLHPNASRISKRSCCERSANERM